MTYSEIRQITNKLKNSFYVDDEFLESGIDTQISNAFKDTDNISPVSIVMLDSNNIIREVASKISDNESTILEIMETLIIDIIFYYKEDLDIQYVYECVDEIESIINDSEPVVGKDDVDACVDFLYQNVFYNDKNGDIVAFAGWSVDNTILNFMVN